MRAAAVAGALAASAALAEALPLDPDLLKPPQGALYSQIALRGFAASGALAFTLGWRLAQESCPIDLRTKVLAVRGPEGTKLFRISGEVNDGYGWSRPAGTLQEELDKAQCGPAPAPAEFDAAGPEAQGKKQLAALGPLSAVCRVGGKAPCRSPDGKWTFALRDVPAAPDGEGCREEVLSYVLVSAGGETTLRASKADKKENCPRKRRIDLQVAWSSDARRIAVAANESVQPTDSSMGGRELARLDVFDVPEVK